MKLVQAVAVAAMLVVPAAAFAASATTSTTATTNSSTTGAQDLTGVATLGVDITNAGNTADSVKQFLAGLPADQSSKVLSGCGDVIANQASASPIVLTFCQNATGKM